MREKKPCLIVTFPSTTAAMAMEAAALKDGLPGRIIPLPQSISAGCGLAFKTAPGEKEALMCWLSAHGLSWETMQEILI